MTPDYTESVDGKVMLALFDHRLRRGVQQPAGVDGGTIAVSITIAYRSPDFEQSAAAITEALLRYLVINPLSSTEAAHDYLRDKVEMIQSAETNESIHRARLTLGDLEHVFGMDGLASDYVRLEQLQASARWQRLFEQSTRRTDES